MVWLRVPYFFLQQRYARRQNQNAQSQRQQNLPSHFHELVKAVPRERATIPDIEVHKSRDLRGKPEDILHSNSNSGNQQHQPDQSENRAESCESNRLNPEERMLRHSRRIEKAHCREKEKRRRRKK